MLFACGVTLGSGGEESEFFTSLTVTGHFTAGGELTLEASYSQVYPANLDVVCDLLDPGRPTPTPEGGTSEGATATPTPVRIPKPDATPATRVLEILHRTVSLNGDLPTVTQGRPFAKVTPVVGSLTAPFLAPEKPGRYIVRCYTSADDNNQIRKTIRIRPAPAPTP